MCVRSGDHPRDSMMLKKMRRFVNLSYKRIATEPVFAQNKRNFKRQIYKTLPKIFLFLPQDLLGPGSFNLVNFAGFFSTLKDHN